MDRRPRRPPGKRLKIYLDDERPCPDGWVLARWPDEVIEIIESMDVYKISLDHDLGDDNLGTGYDVLLWLEEKVATTDFTPPKILIHTANPAARIRMEKCRERIDRFVRARSKK